MAQEVSSIKYSVVAFRNPVINVWTLPRYIQGIDEEAIEIYKQQLLRSCLAGQVEKSNLGLEVYLIGQYDDESGEIHPFPRSEYKLLAVLDSPDKVRIN